MSQENAFTEPFSFLLAGTLPGQFLLATADMGREYGAECFS